ncbi:hypothetical protein K2173_024551 [Erythroxylum novogranatense]|uniref:EGF-like domain-containing protein n=1 Tax=Erythroxylum novogranatense TaxID=1862640 RepID=A0AAV8SUM2_9ROSI|nr:hypothetical protein K2173_024551 [Erythroxylum novogranatense]
MVDLTLKLTLTFLHLFLFTLITCNPSVRSEKLTATVLEGTPIMCALINCGQGTCVANESATLGFDCQCHPGWRKMQLGPLTFPSCIVPNCTLDFQCGNDAPPSPPPPPPPVSVPAPLFNISSPCNLVWCGHGTCMANGSDHTCQCNEGSANLFNKTNLACFKECSFGADCLNLGFTVIGQPPLSLLPPPTPPASGLSGNGSRAEGSYSPRIHIALAPIILAATFAVSV